MSPRRLFVGIEGVVTTGQGVVPYAKPFMHWATQHFVVCWLSAGSSPSQVFALARELGLSEDAVPFMGVLRSRAEQLSLFPGSLLVDVPLAPAEAALLVGRFFPVDPRVGVVPALRGQVLAA